MTLKRVIRAAAQAEIVDQADYLAEHAGVGFFWANIKNSN